jgi:hypothetical protein
VKAFFFGAALLLATICAVAAVLLPSIIFSDRLGIKSDDPMIFAGMGAGGFLALIALVLVLNKVTSP